MGTRFVQVVADSHHGCPIAGKGTRVRGGRGVKIEKFIGGYSMSQNDDFTTG